MSVEDPKHVLPFASEYFRVGVNSIQIHHHKYQIIWLRKYLKAGPFQVSSFITTLETVFSPLKGLMCFRFSIGWCTFSHPAFKGNLNDRVERTCLFRLGRHYVFGSVCVCFNASCSCIMSESVTNAEKITWAFRWQAMISKYTSCVIWSNLWLAHIGTTCCYQNVNASCV